MFRYRTGVAWRDLPGRFGPWQTVWKRHHRFATDGTWDKLLRVIQAETDPAGRVDWNVSVDSSIVRAHQHSATAKRSAREDRTVLVEHTGAVSIDKNPRCCRDEPGDHALGRSRGGLSTKIHAAVDGRGRPLVILLTPGQAGDAPMTLPLLAHLRVQRTIGRPRTRPDRWPALERSLQSGRIWLSSVVVTELYAGTRSAEDARHLDRMVIAMQVVLAYERAAGREPVDVSKTGVGYDIKSEAASGPVRYIEVKSHTTSGDVLLYYTEWQTAHRMRDEFYIYAVNYALSDPQLWIIQDPVGKGVQATEKVVEYHVRAEESRALAEAAPGGVRHLEPPPAAPPAAWRFPQRRLQRHGQPDRRLRLPPGPPARQPPHFHPSRHPRAGQRARV